MLSPGVQLGNRYRLDERIASGGMGDVWRGTDQVLGRTVAVKSLLPALLDDPDFAERFRGEARTMATINHPGVVDVYDFGNDQQIAFLVMEYVEGDALSATLARVGRLTPARTMALVAQAADALHAAHVKGIVHRDVKPGNLLVRPNGTLVLTDFGIARSDLVAQLTAAGSVLGTASYISPEQATGGVATPASDVYALGVVAYQCLAGRRPFEGDNPLEIAMRHVREAPRPLPADIPPQVRAVVERALAPVPPARPMAYAGQAAPPTPQPGGRRSRPGMVFLAIILAVLVLVCSGVISYNLRERSQQSGAADAVLPRTVTSGALRPDGRDDPAGTSYRRQELPRSGGDETTSEGRQTR